MSAALPDPRQIDALISLLDDTDNEVVMHVTDELLRYGFEIIPRLEHAWEDHPEQLIQERLENIIHRIQFDHVKEMLQLWIVSGGKDLLDAMIIVARYQYPDLDEAKIRNQIESIRIDAWMEMNYYLTALEKVRILNHIFFRIHGYSGNTDNYNDPQNSFINKVLESRKGNPISMCLLYMIIAQRLKVPIYGVNLPQHFILTYLDDSEESLKLDHDKREPLFYINAFNRGMVFGRKEIDQFLNLIKMEPHARFYEPCNNFDIITRVFNNLIHSYTESGKPEKAEEITRLREMLMPYTGNQLGGA